MLNEEKVRLMSKMALFESGEGKEAIAIDKYSKKDYMFIQVIKTWVLSTIGFILVLFLALLLCMDFVSKVLAAVSLTAILITIMVLYVACVVFFCVYSRNHAIKRYDEAKEKVKVYKEYVIKLEEMYKSEQSL